MKQNFLVWMLIIVSIFVIAIYTYQSQQTQHINKVAFISLSEVDNNTFAGFKEEMRALGYNENENIQYISLGAAQTVSNLKPIIATVLSKKPDLILVSSTPATQEVKRATENLNIPVVFCPVNDPVSSNIVKNPKAPEGHITGIRLPIGDGKRFEWLYKIVPSIKTVLVPYTPKDESALASIKNIIDTNTMIHLTIVQQPFPEDMSVKTFFDKYHDKADAIFLPRDSRIEARIDEFINYSNQHKLPLSAPSYQQVEKGALFTYGFIHKELGKNAAIMANRILKGVQPTDLPVIFGNSYLVINEKTAKIIGIELPQSAIRNAHIIIK